MIRLFLGLNGYVSKLEAGADVKLSTLQRYCGAIGQAFPPRLGKRAA